MKLVIFTSFLLLSIAIRYSQAVCGPQSCPATKEGHLNVHLVPHSHDDVGWLKTVQQYYNGERNEIQIAEIRKIITTVVTELAKSPERRFTQVETAFLWRWWNEQDDEHREIMRNLVNNGQLEFNGGGWSVNDEGCPNYVAIIDQMSVGLRFLNNTFGSCAHPKTAWQIDPFGHSMEHGGLFAEMGFDGLYFGRLDYQDKQNRMNTKTMEFLLNANPTLGKSSSIFTSVLYNLYQPPSGFCYDTVFCSDSFSESKVDDFINKANAWAAPYRTNHILMTMGSDFHFQNAEYWYTNLDLLIEAVNARQLVGTKINLVYSTPTCYLQEVNRANMTWISQSSDFFPYADAPHDFWTGYFTSRPTFKYFIQKATNYLQACKQLTAMTDDEGLSGNNLSNIFKLEEALGIMQHHDGITGTAKQHVTDDYSTLIDGGLIACDSSIDAALMKIESQEDPSGLQLPHTFCHLTNISACSISEQNTEFVLSIYNPVHWSVFDYIRIPINDVNFQIEGPSGIMTSQLVPIPAEVLNIPGRNSSATAEIVFPTGELPGLSITNFKFTPNGRISPVYPKQIKDKANLVLRNSVGVQVTIDGETNLLSEITVGRTSLNLTQNLLYYKSYRDFNGRPSGAYIFRPDGDPIPFSNPTINIYEGSEMTEIHQTFSSWVSQIIRIYDTSYAVEFEWLVGPIPVDDGHGKEVISKFSSDLDTKGIFYTDASGRQLMKRERNKRPTWNYEIIEPVTGNYYPINSRLIMTEGDTIQENKKTFMLFNDRSQGGSSIVDGEAELMLHRRCLRDDALGVGEPLNEQAFGTGLVARGKIWLVLTGDETGLPTSIHRPLAQEIFMSRIVAFRNSKENDKPFTAVASRFSGLVNLLPINCHLLSLDKISDSEFLLRLEHYYGADEDPIRSQDFYIQVDELKAVLGAQTIEETTLGGHMWKSELSRLDWQVEDGGVANEKRFDQKLNETLLRFQPMQIRTFIFST